jgi:gamma-glutamyl hercynylcysteine S-oxide synthase
MSSPLDQARFQTDSLFSMVDPAALYDRPVADRHRLIFYLGHVEAFDWNLLSKHALDKPAFHPEFDKLFAFGIDPEPGRAPSDQPADWPSEKEVREYCRRVRQTLDANLAAVPEQLVHVAAEHRMMHAETLAYLFHNLPYESKHGPAPLESPNAPVENPMIEIPGGTAVLGRTANQGFGWDNEFDEHHVNVPAFRISRFKITNGEYLKFVQSTGAPGPHFWVARDGRWFQKGMFGEIPLPLDWPVYVTHREALDYTNSKAGMVHRHFTLPTEAQFHRAAEGATPANADFSSWDPIPVNTPGGESGKGPDWLGQLVGNGWEWTGTVFSPFQGFKPFEFYPGYSADFFDGKHFVMKGGSPRTAGALLRSSFRNWFRADYPYVYAGFRLVEGV